MEITCRTAVLIKYISHQKNGGFHGFILDAAGALQGAIEGIMEKVLHCVVYMRIVEKVYGFSLKSSF